MALFFLLFSRKPLAYLQVADVPRRAEDRNSIILQKPRSKAKPGNVLKY